MRNCPAYLETLGACFKARLTPVNVNYRYVADELWYILDNSDSKIVVYGTEFAANIPALRDRLPNVALWIEVCDGAPSVEFAVSFDELAEIGDGARARHRALRRRHDLPLYRRHDRHAEGRDVGARRPLACRRRRRDTGHEHDPAADLASTRRT